MTATTLERSTPILFESVLIETDRNPIPVDIKQTVTDIDVYEHIDKPYVSASLTFIDTQDIVGGLDISGAERVHIKVKANTEIASVVSKTFYISRIVTSIKGSENSEMIILHLVEDVSYISNLQNVNKAYTGTPSDILNKISTSFLGKEILTSTTDTQDMKVIVPNLSPLESMSWIKNRATDGKGYPFFLFSTLGKDSLLFTDLKTMIEKVPSNNGSPYMFTQSTIPSADENYSDRQRRRTILSYETKNTEDLYQLIGKGLVGANHNYIDITKNEIHNIQFDLNKDVIETLNKDGSVKSSPLYSPDYKYNNNSFNEIQSRSITQIGGTNAFENNKTYSESDTKGRYRLNCIGRAMYELLLKQPMSIRVNGIDFLQTEGNNTIGNKLDIKFLRNVNDQSSSSDKFDTKKSGHFLLYSAKHSFKVESYEITFTCVKLSNGEV